MSEHTKEEAEQIAIHVEMLLDDEMRAHAYADAKAHDLPFQIFRVLRGYREAIIQLAALKAQRDELLAAANRIEAWWRLPNIARTIDTIETPMRAIIEAIANAEKRP